MEPRLYRCDNVCLYIRIAHMPVILQLEVATQFD